MVSDPTLQPWEALSFLRREQNIWEQNLELKACGHKQHLILLEKWPIFQ